MSPRTRAVAGVMFLSAVLAVYFVFVGVRAVALLGSGTLIAVLMGIALLILPLIGVWALVRELRFGFAANRLAGVLESSDRMPEEEVDTRPSGRPVREQADAIFPKYRDAVEARPDSWVDWMRLGVVYDACGDRRRARAAIREAIARERTSRREESSGE
jgi:cytochrome c-type biogenesis protein CcmH/NrfG